ncbi:MAG: chemotaxis protein CheX [Selenomonadaceae bacterium]|nr:chemotaxis protein CheX [Selenomonadaceae bacterium]
MGSRYLAGHLRDYETVARELEQEIVYYDAYMALFMRYLEEYLSGEATIADATVSLEDLPTENHVAYQGMGGDWEIVTAIMAEEAPFLAFAQRYSGEELAELDDMAVDAVEEFLNVVNGFFSVQLAKGEPTMELDLEPPQYARDVEPLGSHLLSLRLHLDFGDIYVLLSSDVVFGET